jgi:Flp pilus assembly protein TadB
VVFTGLIIAGALAARVPVIVVAILAAVLFAPMPLVVIGFVCLAPVVWRRGRSRTRAHAESVFLRGVAAELRAGATLRMAMGAAADRTPELELSEWVRAAAAGWPLAELSMGLRRTLPVSGRAAAAAVEFASGSGGSASEVFSSLAAQTDEAIALDRERRLASSQARLSALVVGGAPLPVLGWLLARGTLADLLASRAGVLLLGAGLALVAIGTGITVFQIRRAAR